MASGSGSGDREREAGGREGGAAEGRKAGAVEINENSVNEEEPSFRKRRGLSSEAKGREGRGRAARRIPNSGR